MIYLAAPNPAADMPNVIAGEKHLINPRHHRGIAEHKQDFIAAHTADFAKPPRQQKHARDRGEIGYDIRQDGKGCKHPVPQQPGEIHFGIQHIQR